jgi:N-methylhydantoinase B/oxoprolinase/acetone carboxylase alpha subunit
VPAFCRIVASLHRAVWLAVRSALSGRNSVERIDGRVEVLDSTAAVAMNAGDVFVIETPGGGFGRPAHLREPRGRDEASTIAARFCRTV